MKKFYLLAVAVVMTVLSVAAPQRKAEALQALQLNAVKAAPVQKHIPHAAKAAKAQLKTTDLISKKDLARPQIRKAVKDDELDYDYSVEPETKSDFAPEVLQFTYRQSTAQTYFMVDLLTADGEIYLILNDSTHSTLPVGEFPIDFTGEQGTFDASTGYYDYSAWGLGVFYEPAYFLNGDDYYFLISGKVTISETAGVYTISVDAVSANGSTVKTSYTGEAADPNYIYEPTTATAIDVTFENAEYEYDDEDGVMTIWLWDAESTLALDINVDAQVVPTGVLPINATGDANTVVASAGGNNHSYYLTDLDEEGYAQTVYYLVDGKVTITLAEGVYTVVVEATTYNGSTIKVTYTGALDEAADPAFQYEPTEVSTFNVTANDMMYIDYVEDYGDYYVYLYQVDEDDNTLYTTVIDLVTTEAALPVGEFEINGTYTAGTVYASEGVQSYDGQNYPIPTYFIDRVGQAYYFIVSGKVTISKDADDNYTITLAGVSYNGSTINVTYTGALNEYEETEEEDEAYSYENENATQVEMVATEVEETYYAPEGQYIGEYYITFSDDESHRCVLALVANEELADWSGTYTFNELDEYDELKLLPSTGIDDEGYVYPPYFSSVSANGGLSTPIYFIMDGELKIAKVDDGYAYEFEGISYYGSTIKVTYGTMPAEETALNNVTVEGISFANGIVRNHNNVELTVFNAAGKLVAASNSDIDLTEAPAGLYIVKAADSILKVVK